MLPIHAQSLDLLFQNCFHGNNKHITNIKNSNHIFTELHYNETHWQIINLLWRTYSIVCNQLHVNFWLQLNVCNVYVALFKTTILSKQAQRQSLYSFFSFHQSDSNSHSNDKDLYFYVISTLLMIIGDCLGLSKSSLLIHVEPTYWLKRNISVPTEAQKAGFVLLRKDVASPIWCSG